MGSGVPISLVIALIHRSPQEGASEKGYPEERSPLSDSSATRERFSRDVAAASPFVGSPSGKQCTRPSGAALEVLVPYIYIYIYIYREREREIDR